MDLEIAGCTRCGLHSGRTNIVVGVGSESARIMFVGEAPGRDEDLRGEPFVGQAGQLLNRMLERAEISRDSIYIANVVKCRPPGNRDPEPEEIVACFPYLKKQVEIIKPKVLVTLGRYAACRLACRWGTMRDMLDATDLATRDELFNIPIVAQYHPAYLLRQGRETTDKPKTKALFQDFVDRLKKAKDTAGEGL